MFTNNEADLWKNSIEYMHDAVYYYSLWNGDYPYKQCTAVDGTISAGGGMEYPNVTVIGESRTAIALEEVIMHEVGHNWFYGMLASNERDHPWMDEGLNSFDELRYMRLKYPEHNLLNNEIPHFFTKMLDLKDYTNKNIQGELMYFMNAWTGKDQPIELHSCKYTRQHIEKDGALERRFQKVIVNPTTIDETIEILTNIKIKYEEHHNVEYTQDAIKACVILTDRYMNDRFLPDKAIDALDEAGSRVHITNIEVPQNITNIEKQLSDITTKKKVAIKKQKFEIAAELRDSEKKIQSQLVHAQDIWEKELKANKETVSEENVADVVSIMTGIPVNRVASQERKKLSSMTDNIKKKIIGQNEAVEKVVKAIRRNRVGLKDPSKPIGSFIFLGPTGVGKTQLTKALSEEIGLKYFGINFNAYVAIFNRSSDNLIDYTRENEDDKWEATNLKSLNSTGAELNLSSHFKSGLYPQNISLGYTYLDENLNDVKAAYSKYVINSLTHHFTATVRSQFMKNVSQSIIYKFAERSSGTSYSVVDVQATLAVSDLELSIIGNNIFNAEYVETGFVPMPKGNVLVGVKYSF